jgi:haloalkane dehalogenase
MQKVTTVLTGDAIAFDEHRILRNGHMLLARDYAGVEPAFVLMHGFPDNLRIYDRLAPALAASGRRVIAFDFLGYGGSDKPADYPYTAQNMEGDLDAVVGALGVGQVVPVAHDASGPTAINWSLGHRDRVAALALLNTYYDAAPTLQFPEFISLFADPKYSELAAAFVGDPAQFGWLLAFQGRRFLQDAPPAMRELMEPELVRIIRGQFAASPSVAPAFVSLTRELHSAIAENTRRVTELSEFRPKVALIWGIGDPYLNAGVAEHLKGLFPNSWLTSLNGGHWPQIEAPEDVAKSLLCL